MSGRRTTKRPRHDDDDDDDEAARTTKRPARRSSSASTRRLRNDDNDARALAPVNRDGATRQLLLHQVCRPGALSATEFNALRDVYEETVQEQIVLGRNADEANRVAAEVANLLRNGELPTASDAMCTYVFRNRILDKAARKPADIHPDYPRLQADMGARAAWGLRVQKALVKRPPAWKRPTISVDFDAQLQCDHLLGTGTFAVVWQMSLVDPNVSVFPIAVKDQFAKPSYTMFPPDPPPTTAAAAAEPLPVRARAEPLANENYNGPANAASDEDDRRLENHVASVLSKAVTERRCPHFGLVFGERANHANGISCSAYPRGTPIKHNMIAIELCDDSLDSWVEHNWAQLDCTTVLCLAAQMFFATSFMHLQHLTHNDLYLRNVLLNHVPPATAFAYRVSRDLEMYVPSRSILLKIADFGTATCKGFKTGALDHTVLRTRVRPYYMPRYDIDTIPYVPTDWKYCGGSADGEATNHVAYFLAPSFARDVLSLLNDLALICVGMTTDPKNCLLSTPVPYEQFVPLFTWCQTGLRLLQQMCRTGAFQADDGTASTRAWMAQMFASDMLRAHGLADAAQVFASSTAMITENRVSLADGFE